MTKIYYKTNVKYKKKMVPAGALLDSGSDNCYIGYNIAKLIGIDIDKLSYDYVGLGYKRRRYGPFTCTFISPFGKKKYKARAKTYAIDTSKEIFHVLLSGNWIKKSKLPIQKITERGEKYEY